MAKKNKQEKKEITNVEFGVEFGDLNASKMYERPFPEKKSRKKK